MRQRTIESSNRAARESGLSLIELMISLVLGLMVVGAAIGMFLSNHQTYRATESLARVQENARVAFELMAREVREAAGNPCAANLPIANVLNNPGASWWSNWAAGVIGYDNGALSGTATGTDALELMSATSSGVTITEVPSANSANFKVNTADHGFEEGEILMVCDYSQASIFQATNVNSTNVTIVHNTGGSVSPGNCTKGLGLPVVCTANGTGKIYGPNSLVVKLHAARWFVADNGRNGRSLYRQPMNKGALGAREEVSEGISDMQIQYLVAGAVDYVDAAPGIAWQSVTAVRITLSLEGRERVGTDGGALVREISHVVNLRNRTS
ncbi:PilW family protein [Novilysobacter antarcticus]|uniref:PilW family protein n=1 Tax=Novilysobacter antarcticus TaxID=2862543 RepID=UPI001C99412C|nr:pilus assembly protein PilW [Lysobacter antarcticus]